MSDEKHENVRMNYQQLKELRQSIGFDMKSMALCCGIPKSTYQRYEDGTAAIPHDIQRAALELKQIDETFMADATARIDAIAAREYMVCDQ